MSSTPARIGLWGAFDVRSFGEALVPQVLRRELAARLPGPEVRAAAPDRCARPAPRDGGEPAEPLGAWSPERAAALAADLDCIVVSGADLLSDPFFLEGPGPEAEGHCPVVWHAVVLGSDPTPEEAARLREAAARRAHISVGDEASRRRLVAAGVERDIEVATDPAVLAHRLFPPGLLAKRLDYLRTMRWYPQAGAPLVLEAGVELLAYVAELGASLARLLEARPELPVVLAEMGSAADAELAAKLAEQLPEGSVTTLPPEAGLEDCASAIAAAALFAGVSPRTCLAARALGRPATVVRGPEELARLLEADQTGGPEMGSAARRTKETDLELDRIAGIAEAAARVGGGAPGVSDADRLAALTERLARAEAAHEARSRRHAVERAVFGDFVNHASQEIADLKAEIARMKEEYRTQVELWQSHHKEEAALRATSESELASLRATRTFRYSAELRQAYGRLRRLLDLPQDRRPT